LNVTLASILSGSALPTRRLPAVLTQDQVVHLLKAEANRKMRTAYTAIYAAGLRVCEVVALTIHDIDSARMVIHIGQAKGRKDRIVMLSDQLTVERVARRHVDQLGAPAVEKRGRYRRRGHRAVHARAPGD
jgi:site-specific recombinase XerD